MDDLSDTLCRFLDPAQLASACHADPTWRQAAQRVLLDLGEFVHDLNVDPGIYRAIQRSIARYETAPEAARATDPALRDYTDESLRVGRMLLRDCERCGVHLDERGRADVARISGLIRGLELDILQTCADPTESGSLQLQGGHADVQRLPPGLRHLARVPRGGARGGLGASIVSAFGRQNASGGGLPHLPLDSSTMWGVLHECADRECLV